MPRLARISISRDSRNLLRPWLLNIPASLSQSGKRERPAYATRGQAERARSDEEHRLADYSRRTLGLTDRQQVEAVECFSLIEPFAPHTLRDAVRLAVGAWDAEKRSVPIERLAEEAEMAKKQDGCGGDHVRTIRYTMSGFCEDFSGRSVASITAGEVDRWLRGQVRESDGERVSPGSRNTFRACLSLCWSYAKVQGWVGKNIIVDVPRAKKEKDNEEDDEVVFLSPEQTEAFLHACPPRLIAHAALCAFGALRPVEAAKMTWQDIGAKELRVRASISKTRSYRDVPVSAQLREWLSCAWRQKSGKIGFFRSDFRAACIAAGLVPWPQNGLRHSYGTYRFQIISENDLARQMGNSPEVIIKYYRGMSNPETAARYFAIMPDEADRAKADKYKPSHQSHRRKS